jgi:hypothetical protein
MERAVHREHPRENRDEALDFDVHARVDPRMDHLARAIHAALKVAAFGVGEDTLEDCLRARRVALRFES